MSTEIVGFEMMVIIIAFPIKMNFIIIYAPQFVQFPTAPNVHNYI